MNHTIAKVDLASIEEAIVLLDTTAVKAAFDQAPGFRAVYLNVNLEEPGEVISISVWDSAEQG